MKNALRKTLSTLLSAALISQLTIAALGSASALDSTNADAILKDPYNNIYQMSGLNVYINDNWDPSQIGSDAGKNFLHTSGKSIVDKDGKAFIIKSMNIVGGSSDERTDPYVSNEYNESTYEQLRVMGFNTVKIFLNDKLFDDIYKKDASGNYLYDSNNQKIVDWNCKSLTWLRLNVTWAKNNNIKLMFHMHSVEGMDNYKLYTDKSYQQNLIDIWTVIAQMLRGEETVIGYSLLNEPTVPRQSTEAATLALYQNLVNDLTASMRAADPNHVFFVERIFNVRDSLTGTFYDDMAANIRDQLVLNDKNTAVEVHLGNPYYLVAIPETDGSNYQADHYNLYTDYGSDKYVYPDESRIAKYDSNTTFTPVVMQYNPAMNKIDVTKNTWQHFVSSKYIPNTSSTMAMVTFDTSDLGGIAYFDNIKVKEYDAVTGKYLGDVISTPLNSPKNTFVWNNNGTSGYDRTEGYNGNGSVWVKNTSGSCTASTDIIAIRPKAACYYVLECDVKYGGTNTNAVITPTLRFSDDDCYTVNKDYLQYLVDETKEYGEKNNIPTFMGEFYMSRVKFAEDESGLNWAKDIMDILATEAATDSPVGFSYHAYTDYNYGLYGNKFSEYPDYSKYNKTLGDVFVEYLKKINAPADSGSSTEIPQIVSTRVVVYDENYNSTAPNTPIFYWNGTALAPVRFLSECLGFKVFWEESTGNITITNSANGERLNLYPDNFNLTKFDSNGKELFKAKMVSPPQLVKGSTYVPLRILTECLGGYVFFKQYTPDTAFIVVSLKQLSEDKVNSIIYSIANPGEEPEQITVYAPVYEASRTQYPAGSVVYYPENGKYYVYTNAWGQPYKNKGTFPGAGWTEVTTDLKELSNGRQKSYDRGDVIVDKSKYYTPVNDDSRTNWINRGKNNAYWNLIPDEFSQYFGVGTSYTPSETPDKPGEDPEKPSGTTIFAPAYSTERMQYPSGAVVYYPADGKYYTYTNPWGLAYKNDGKFPGYGWTEVTIDLSKIPSSTSAFSFEKGEIVEQGGKYYTPLEDGYWSTWISSGHSNCYWSMVPDEFAQYFGKGTAYVPAA